MTQSMWPHAPTSIGSTCGPLWAAPSKASWNSRVSCLVSAHTIAASASTPSYLYQNSMHITHGGISLLLSQDMPHCTRDDKSDGFPLGKELTVTYQVPCDHIFLQNHVSCTGAKDGCLHMAWHPARSSFVTVGTSGKIYVWSKIYKENWSAFAPDFEELDENQASMPSLTYATLLSLYRGKGQQTARMSMLQYNPQCNSNLPHASQHSILCKNSACEGK